MGLPVIASVSGGKDSTALCLYLKDQSIPFRAVHMATGWEHPKTEEYLREVLPKYIGPIEWLIPERQMVDLIRYKGMFPSRTRRYCTQFLKIFVLKAWANKIYPDERIVNAVGVRAAESRARAKLGEYEEGEWARIWRPLISWACDDVIAIHKEYGCPMNPLYALGLSRVGCWPCIFARKSEIRLVASVDPGRIDLIRQLEAEVAEAACLRYAKKGQSFESLGYSVPSFFALKKYVMVGGKRVRKNVCCPVDEVVEWSRTARGGKQREV